MIYRLLTNIAGPYLRGHLRRRALRGKEDATRLNERYGVALLARPTGKLIWFHAASVGEGVALLVLIKAIIARYPTINILVTSGTVNSAQILGKRLPPNAIHQYVPIDRYAWVTAFLDHWQPDAAIWTESEIWPNLLLELRKRNIPAAMVNGRLSENSAKHWKLLAGTFKRLLQNFLVRLAQSEEDAARLSNFGVPFRHVGNLKLAVEPAPVDIQAAEALKQAIGARPVWLAASTHPGEEEIVFAVHKRIVGRYPDLLTIIAPRHAVRGDEIAALATVEGLDFSRRSKGQLPQGRTPVYLADTMGELGTLYNAAQIVFVGGSLTFDGHSPVEAAQYGAAIIYGPLMRNNSSIATALKNAGGAQPVANGDELAAAILAWFENPAAAKEVASNAQRVTEEGKLVVAQIMTELQPLFDMARLA